METYGKDKEIRKRFGLAMRRKRLKLKISQEKFAELADLHRTYISDIELGKVDIGLSVASKIAKALKTKLSRLMNEIE